jgi:ABC-type multidrug transport system fused ATPase/permease subunit
MLRLLFKIWLSIFANYCLSCQSTSVLDRTNLKKLNRRHRYFNIKRSIFLSNNDDDLEIETTDVTTISSNKQNTLIKLLTKLIIMFLIFAAFAVLITIVIGLIFLCINCSRPSRIHRDIPIEYLDSSEMINYLDRTSMSERSSIENI